MQAIDYQAARRGPGLRSAALSIVCVALLGIYAITSAAAQDSKKKSPPEKTPTVAARHVLVFPPDTKGGVGDQVSDDILGVEESRLTVSKLYSPIEFLTSIPTVKLALSEQTISVSDVKKPFDSDAKLKKLSGVTGYDMVLVASIDDYSYDSAKNQVSVVMSARLIDYAGAKPVVRSAAQSAESPATGGNTPEIKVAGQLVRTLMDKLMTAILTPKPPTPAK